jgi:uncharacterized membrane-anchored protein YhcB (DUF1043 family)
MKYLGYILMSLGFIISSLIAVMQVELVNWNYFIPAMIIGIIGVVIIRISIKKHEKGEDKVGLDMANIKKSLSNIVGNMKQFNEEKTNINVYDIHGKLDEIFLEDIESFLKARESIIHQYGMQDYADLMNHFAAGERYLNRSWSASADGYIDESYLCVEKAFEQFTIAQEHFVGYKEKAVNN